MSDDRSKKAKRLQRTANVIKKQLRIAKAFGLALQRGEKSPDLGKEEFVAINNFLIMIANAVSFDGSKFISCLKWIHDNILGEATAKRVKRDNIYGLSRNADDDD